MRPVYARLAGKECNIKCSDLPYEFGGGMGEPVLCKRRPSCGDQRSWDSSGSWPPYFFSRNREAGPFVLCGKDRRVLSVKIVGWDVMHRRAESGLSRVLEPLVHAHGIEHKWREIEGHALIGWALEWSRSRVGHDRILWIRLLRRHFEDVVDGPPGGSRTSPSP